MQTINPKSMIAGVQSVMPVEVTKHRKVRSISVADPIGVGIFRRTLNIVTYYKLEGDNSRERGWLVGGWIKESLGRAMTEQPMLSGRLRKKEEDGLEVVANDSGVRLVEATFPASLPDFLGMVKRNKGRAEAEVVFWRNIDEDDPQFSPLFYIQVTNFESGGYSIGISCSIIIADLLLDTNFLTKWDKIQNSLAHSKTLKPIFHLPSLKQNLLGNFFLTEHSRSDSILDRGELGLFRGKTCSEMSLACMKKAVGKGSVDVFLLFNKQDNGDNSSECDSMKVEIYSRDEAIGDCGCDLEETDVGTIGKNLAFGERVEVTSCWVGSVSKGVVFVLPSTFGDTKVIVALPKE